MAPFPVLDASGTRPPTSPYPFAQQSPTRRPPSAWRRINSAIFNINNRLTRLAGLGRPGQWVVHNEDLYETEIDTRPDSRNRDEEIPICGLDYKGFLIKDRGIIWAGKKPPPDFQNALYWESKADELETKIKEIEAGLLDHQFTPEELARIEAMERQEGHFFQSSLVWNKQELQTYKNSVRNLLTIIANLGRPGQWVLHHEDIYHPNIDTRPQSRKTQKGVPIRGFTLDNVQSNAEYFWAGKGQPPDFEDHLYWKRKANELAAKWQEIKDGQVHPQFTQEELSALQLMEHNEAHFFCISERLRREKPTIRPLTPSSRDASEELKLARSLVWCEMTNLWGLGLPGKWVLHHEDIYLPECDTRCRDDDESFPIPPIAAHEGFEKSDFGLRYDGDLPLPDFNDLAYWEAKLEKLKKKTQEVEDEIVEHKFTSEDLMRLALLDRDRSREGASGRKPMGEVDAWLGRQNDPQAQPNSTQSSQADVTWQTTWLPSRAGSPISIHSRRACSADSTGDSSFGDKRLQLLRVRDRVLNRAQELSKLGSETRQVVEGCGFRFQHTLSIDLENTTFNSIKMDGRDTWYTAQEVEPRYDSAAFWEVKGNELDKIWRPLRDELHITEGSSSKSSRSHHPESTIFGVSPPSRKRHAGILESLPAQIIRSTKRRKVMQQPDTSPKVTPRLPLATKDGGRPPQNQTKPKPPTSPSSDRSRLRPPAVVLPTSPPSSNSIGATKRRRSQRQRVEARDSSRQLRSATRSTRTRRRNASGVNQAQPKMNVVPEPNHQPKLRRSARIAAILLKERQVM